MIKITAPQRSHEYKCRAEKKGGHIHLIFFSRPLTQATWACLGHLVIAEDEAVSWAEVFASNGLAVESKESKDDKGD